MVLAGETLFIAGPRGDTNKSLDAFEGKEGIVLQAVSTFDGKVLSELSLDSLPVFDGMAAAYGCLYLPTVDGNVTCFTGD